MMTVAAQYDPVCHCGITLSKHSAYDNHPFTDMEQPPEEMELKPCPFCGPGASVVTCYLDDDNYWTVGCGRCGSHGGKRPKSDPGAMEAIITLWNTRSVDPEATREVCRLADQLQRILNAWNEYGDDIRGGLGSEYGNGVAIALSAYDKLRLVLDRDFEASALDGHGETCQCRRYGPCECCGGPTDHEGECSACRDFGGTDKLAADYDGPNVPGWEGGFAENH